MWTRAELKSRAKQVLRKYYWYALLMCFIAAMLGGGSASGGSGTSFSFNFGNSSSDSSEESIWDQPVTEAFDSFALNEEMAAWAVVVGIVIVIVWVIAIVFGTFVGNPVRVGLKRYMLESRTLERSAGIGKLFWVFSCGEYLNVVKIMFLKDLYRGLWMLLLVIPGIIKDYEYSMIPYILAENPELSSKEVFRLSREMTMGEKANMFVLDLSFIGWEILGVLVCCGVGLYFLNPYIEATYAELYMVLREKATGVRFNGFGDEIVYIESNERKDPFADYDLH